ncbi:alpha/beta hydrolase [candidate division KSB1 bacterium]|nr:alpha/beta hydrolase [candidate division KSB1 bacterium]
MKKIKILLVPVLLFFAHTAGPSLAQNRPMTDEDRAFMEIVNKPVVYRVPGMDAVKVLKDRDYKKTNNPNLKMDVYLPPNLPSGAKRPAVVFIHGGAGEGGDYRPKDWGIYQSYGKLIAASGLVAVTFTQSLGFPKTAVAEAANDLNDLLNHIRANAEAYNIDKEKIALVAFSAGGPLLSFGMMGKTPYIRCLVSVYNFLDIQQTEHHRQSETKETIQAYSPINHLANAANIPPIFIIRAGRDQIPNLNDTIDRFVREAIARNITIDFANHPEGAHGFDNKEENPRAVEIIRRMVEFLKTHLGV